MENGKISTRNEKELSVIYCEGVAENVEKNINYIS